MPSRFQAEIRRNTGLMPIDKGYNQSYTQFVKTAISVPDRVFRSAEAFARRRGLTRSQLFATAVSEYLARHQAEQVTELLNRVYGTEDSSLPGDVVLLQARSMARNRR
jgi:hypothetical protein